jgi:isochorismate hydrolase
MMKTPYFTHETMDARASAFIKSLKTPEKSNEACLVPEESALLILDMQRFFLDQDSHAFIPSAVPIIPRIRRLANMYILKGLPVIMTRHVNSKANAGLMAEWWKDLIDANKEASDIIPELRIPGAMIIQKSQYDAFFQTSLEASLREKGITQLVITGVMTHLCCETTARSAFIRGFSVFFPADGSATYNEDFHRATLLNLSHGFARIVLVDDLLNQLEAGLDEG